MVGLGYIRLIQTSWHLYFEAFVHYIQMGIDSRSVDFFCRHVSKLHVYRQATSDSSNVHGHIWYGRSFATSVSTRMRMESAFSIIELCHSEAKTYIKLTFTSRRTSFGSC